MDVGAVRTRQGDRSAEAEQQLEFCQRKESHSLSLSLSLHMCVHVNFNGPHTCKWATQWIKSISIFRVNVVKLK